MASYLFGITLFVTGLQEALRKKRTGPRHKMDIKQKYLHHAW
jgi:hypothetical protein